MWVKAKTLLLLLSLALNVPFIALWAANTTQTYASVYGESVSREPTRRESPSASTARGAVPRLYSSRPEGTRSVYREVGVTEEQWHEIEPRLAQFRASMFRLGCEMKRQRDELVELVAAPELDHEAIRAKQEEILESHRRTGDLVTENMLADREILTLEQQEKFFKKLRDYCGPSTKSPTPGNRPPSSKYGPAFGSQRSRSK
jgi:Spy/CpxP family protein refolding chaperone